MPIRIYGPDAPLPRNSAPWIHKLAPAQAEIGFRLAVGVEEAYVRLLYNSLEPENCRAWWRALTHEGAKWWVTFLGAQGPARPGETLKRTVSLNAVRRVKGLPVQACEPMLAAVVVGPAQAVAMLERLALTRDRVAVELSDGHFAWEILYRPSLGRAFSGREYVLRQRMERATPMTKGLVTVF